MSKANSHSFKLGIAAALMLSAYGSSFAGDGPKTPLKDPFGSGNFAYHQVNMLGDPENISFDDRVIVRAPASAEDSFNVPVMVDATSIKNIKQIVMLVDYGPIPKILSFFPKGADAKFAFRFKIDQATPIRAAVETADGAWHIGSTYVDAGGGGCTAPATAYATADWTDKIGQINGETWPQSGRVRVVIDHPMDTGLADGIPVFIINDLRLADNKGNELARLELHEPVNEDPAFTFYVPKARMSEAVEIKARDNNGNEFDGTLRPRLTQ